MCEHNNEQSQLINGFNVFCDRQADRQTDRQSVFIMIAWIYYAALDPP